jgi:hypothetical protein
MQRGSHTPHAYPCRSPAPLAAPSLRDTRRASTADPYRAPAAAAGHAGSPALPPLASIRGKALSACTLLDAYKTAPSPLLVPTCRHCSPCRPPPAIEGSRSKLYFRARFPSLEPSTISLLPHPSLPCTSLPRRSWCHAGPPPAAVAVRWHR